LWDKKIPRLDALLPLEHGSAALGRGVTPAEYEQIFLLLLLLLLLPSGSPTLHFIRLLRMIIILKS
jgi:hypothetical protein